MLDLGVKGEGKAYGDAVGKGNGDAAGISPDVGKDDDDALAAVTLVTEAETPSATTPSAVNGRV